MDYIKSSSQRDGLIGIKSFKVMSSRRKRRCINYQVHCFGIKGDNYGSTVYTIVIPSIKYRYSYGTI
mgnify:CR=1 FL=1